MEDAPASAHEQRARRAWRFAGVAVVFALAVFAADAASFANALRRDAWPWLLVPVGVAASAGAAAYGWAWLLHGEGERPVFGAGRGAVVGLATCITIGLLAAAAMFAGGLAQRVPSSSIPFSVMALSFAGLGSGFDVFASLAAGALVGRHRSARERLGVVAAPVSGPARDGGTAPRRPTWGALFMAGALFFEAPLLFALMLTRARGDSWRAVLALLVPVVFAGIWSMLLAPRFGARRFGPWRGACVALLTYVTGFAVAVTASEIASGSRGSVGEFLLGGLGLAMYSFLSGGFMALPMGALIGWIRPAELVAALGEVARTVSAPPRPAAPSAREPRALAWLRRLARDGELGLARFEQALGASWQHSQARAAGSGSEALFIGVIGLSAIVAAAGVVFVAIVRMAAPGGFAGDGWAPLAFPGAAAIAAGLIAWLAAHRLAAAVAPRHRLTTALLAVAAALLSVALLRWHAWP